MWWLSYFNLDRYLFWNLRIFDIVFIETKQLFSCGSNFYQQLGRGLSLKIEARYDSKLFYAHRRRFNQLVKEDRAQTAEAAQLFYYLNRTCFNGLCRFNQRGEFNVPFGRYKTVNYASDFKAYRNLLRRWSFTDTDIEKLAIKPDDFIYADPP